MTGRIEPPERAPLRAWPAIVVFAAVVFGAPTAELAAGRFPGSAARAPTPGDRDGVVAESRPLAALVDGRLLREIDGEAEPLAYRGLVGPTWREALYLAGGATTPKIVVGRDGWLFASEAVRGYPGPEARTRVADCSKIAAALAELLAAHGTALVCAPVPNKETMHRDRLPRVLGPFDDAYDRVLIEWRRRGVVAVDLRPALDPAVREAWLRDDTHWSSTGARAAADATAEAVRAALGGVLPEPALPTAYATTPAAPRRGDQTAMLGFRKGAPLDRRFWATTSRVVARFVDGRPTETTDPRPIVVCGTSFTAQFDFAAFVGAALGQVVERRAIEGGGPVRQVLEVIEGALRGERPWPKALVWEFPERTVVLAHESFVLQLGQATSLAGYPPDFMRGRGRPLAVAKTHAENATTRPAAGGATEGDASSPDPQIIFDLDEELAVDSGDALAFEVDAPTNGFAELFYDADLRGTWRRLALGYTYAGSSHVALPLAGPKGARTRRIRLDPAPRPGPFRVSAPVLLPRRP